tara:strand:- start:1960 stop:2427 length:468 start_codon:yes stop_codon:yes gene_type:complete
VSDKKQNKSHAEFTKDQKAKRGWWFSVFFLVLVVLLILFLTYVKIVDENRDVLVGILGVITGSISSMVAIASGRDPSEVEELKDKLASANADREALIARLRDAQIQMQLKTDQLMELQTAVINKLSIFANQEAIQTQNEEEVILHPKVEEWIPKG